MLTRYPKQNYFGSNYVLMKLTVNDIQDSDYGVYNCFAENSEGNGESSVRLIRKLLGNSAHECDCYYHIPVDWVTNCDDEGFSLTFLKLCISTP